MSLIGATIVRERDGRPFRVATQVGSELGCFAIEKEGLGRRGLAVRIRQVGPGHGFVVSEPSEDDLNEAQRVTDTAKSNGIAVAKTRRGNLITVTIDDNESCRVCIGVPHMQGRSVYRVGYPPALTSRLACWGARLISTQD